MHFYKIIHCSVVKFPDLEADKNHLCRFEELRQFELFRLIRKQLDIVIGMLWWGERCEENLDPMQEGCFSQVAF